ncbi:CapA family protein [Brevibacillus ruminantium]|uniref:CapA family protein n=1 Tax=Brevibacillus ruminantium TaxID=2950604 RepID=A0ABY4WK70_9BACL|nr:CapA family protein [Brevibacillus ruminantium]USG67530.1 CapA family protein [Brevibacillus ruminantium]
MKRCCSLWVVAALLWGTVGCAPGAGPSDQGTRPPVASTEQPSPVSGADPMPESLPPEESGENTEVPNAGTEPPLSRFPEQRITLMAVGDVMVHDEQLEAALLPDQVSYDFSPSFSHVAPIFQEADWVVGNLETTLAGRDMRFSGYPMFNSPDSLADTLKQIGFTAMTTANNHSMDRKEPGVLRTIEQLDRVGMLHTGTFRDETSRNQPLILTKDDFTMAVLAYTYGTNGIPIPQGKDYLVNLIDHELIKQDIARARETGADLVTVALHFGNEYQRMPSPKQKETAALCIQYGADLVLGAHPHVLQPYEWKTVTLENGQTHTGFIAYSLGNFISAQRREYKDVGAILKLTLFKGENGEAHVEQAEWIPTYVHYYRKNGKRQYVIYPVSQTLAAVQQGQKDPVLTKEVLAYLNRLDKEIQIHLDSLEKRKEKEKEKEAS